MTSEQQGHAFDPATAIPHVIAPPPLIYLLPLVGTLAVGFWQPRPFLPGVWPHVLGPLLLGLGVFLLQPAISAFKAARTNARPWKPSTTLVIEGPYRYTRNPMYLGFTLIYLGVTCWANVLWPLFGLLVVLPVMQQFVIRREERYLERLFGEPYRAYMDSVRRWI